ncbi:ABC transporter permease subunit [Mesobacterium sp. TK19101]|uniref:ABC transporter permease subunit n=1 Tax=Mesobacterium hydrothermale TaxID=3111907 RepID=A0ABU6HJK6_9RHOB|nr:ABC transporter permease subunit [Mesobacterium sp. TK19101]MEC3862086.1 ABC transporter permease subunit [Mesobacterium sp. TK19101]
MTPARFIARQSLAGLTRDRSVLILIAFFAAMVLVTAWLGWSATNTVNAIYADAATYLSASGQPVPPNPVSQTASLAVLRNLGVYISLIGAFGSIVIGQLLIETDRRAGTLPLIGARPFERRDLALGKMRALVTATGAMMAVAGIISVATLVTIPSLVVGPGDLLRLALFLVAGWAYITIFGFLALGAAARMPATASGLIAATVVWLVVTFVLPELTANVHPTAAINPVSTLANTPDLGFFHVMSRVLGPLSLAEGFAWLSGDLLSFLPDGLAPRGPIPPAVTLSVALILAGLFAARSAAKLDLNAGGPDA